MHQSWNNRSTWPAVILEWLCLVLVITTCGLSVWVAPSLPWIQRANLADPLMQTPFELRGFYGWEQNQDFAYRWTRSQAEVRSRVRYPSWRTTLATVRLRKAEATIDQPVTFLVNGQPLATAPTFTTFRTYHMLLPVQDNDDAWLRFGLRMPGLSGTGVQRDLGLLLTDVRYESLPTNDLPGALVVVIGLLVLRLALARRPDVTATTLTALVGLGLAGLAWNAPPAPLSTAVLAACCLLAGSGMVQLTNNRWQQAGLLALTLLAGFSGRLWGFWFTDDAFISFRYADNLVRGNGLVFNLGERVEGFTNFLWTILAACCLWLGADLLFWSYLVGVVLALALIALTYRLGVWLLDGWWALIAAGIVATSQSILLYTARGAGMETGLFTLLALAGAGMYLLARQRSAVWLWWLTGIVFALATLTRPEGMLLLGLSGLHGLRNLDYRQRKQKLQHLFTQVWPTLVPMAGAFLLLVVPFFIWRVSYYGDLLPNTFYAKTGAGIQVFGRGIAYLGESFQLYGLPLLLLGLSGMLVRPTHWMGYLVLLCVSYLAYVISVGGDHFPGERFLVPAIPWLALLTAGGLATLGQRITVRRLQPVAGVVLGALLAWHSYGALMRDWWYQERVRGSDESVWLWRDMGLWLRDETPPDTSIAAMGIGAIAYFSDRTTIDMLGLTDRHIARIESPEFGTGAAGHEKRDPAYVLSRNPTYIPFAWEAYFGGAATLLPQYEPVTISTHHGWQVRMWQRR